ncbi:TetR/AcrR family transcriptional regulator [Labilibacter marinus]|uniref:TetR/AcrR family transcriptional regulator n=1 Tax=Labilibacter marinus TaxID=1477105 RepID=UPI00082DA1FB|nr:TetR/AcrR family transcriptional regulator [Labilibacter marinus]
MTNVSDSYTIWLETAYRLFAEKGPIDFSVKEVAKECGLPRTNFYYYFDNKEDLLDKTLELHIKSTIDVFNVEISNRLHTYIPNLYEVVYDLKLGIQFTKTLFKHRDILKYNNAYIKGNALSADIIIPKFKDYFHINLPDDQVKPLWFILVDAWYSRLSFDNYTVEYLCETCYDIMNALGPLIELANKQGASKSIVDTTV